MTGALPYFWHLLYEKSRQWLFFEHIKHLSEPHYVWVCFFLLFWVIFIELPIIVIFLSNYTVEILFILLLLY